MPVLLLPDGSDVWLRGSFDELVMLQARCSPDELIEITPGRQEAGSDGESDVDLGSTGCNSDGLLCVKTASA